LTIWVGRTLFTNGKRFLSDIFNGDTEMAKSVNKLLLIGFYLINFGYTLMMLTVYRKIPTYKELIETLSIKIGSIVILLGMMHFLNLFILFRLRKKYHIKST